MNGRTAAGGATFQLRGSGSYLDHSASTPCDPAVIALMERGTAHEFAKRRNRNATESTH